MKTTFLSLIILFFISNTLYAEDKTEDKPSQKIPFFGKREFNFYGGNGTEEYLTIKKNGSYVLEACGVAKCSVISKGKYRNPLPADEGNYLIHENKIYSLQKNNEIKKGCMDENEPCVSELLNGG